MKLRPEMEQKKSTSNSNNKNPSKEDRYQLGVAVHSQVRKIRQEMEKIKHPTLEEREMRPTLHEITRQWQRPRSPLGLAERPISV
ncbi:Cadherin-86C like [Actinidia chinensis var. chinensis]|uniref:Cadherin-86C like n=1 Tax=Actinidia chinensis var. chinensis TaxID=1590841 RepID=A0A2R6PGZ4_ACTCC|nr:Cadherin-86C like [Actinidia chinensis var. chinensis]